MELEKSNSSVRPKIWNKTVVYFDIMKFSEEGGSWVE